MHNSRFRVVLGFIFVAVVLAGNISCGERSPFAYKLSSINENAPQQKALILLSDPQFYARATLVDDRRREAEFLEQLLKESKDVQFEPQLRRELASISALSAQLGLSFDPTRALSNATAKEIGELDKEVRVTQLQIQLQQLQQQLTGIRAGEVAVPPPAPPSGSFSNITPPSSFLPPGADVLRSSTEELRALIDKAVQGLKAITGEIKGTTIKSSPQEVFRDRQAYRDELRAALSLVNLDDRHDDNGNALFQLQFRATIFPGRNKDQYGAARVSMSLPAIQVWYLNELYHDILNLVTYEVNAAGIVDEEKGQGIDYEELGRASGLFELAEIYADADASGVSECELKSRGPLMDALSPAARRLKMAAYGCETVYLAVPRNFSAQIRAITSNVWGDKIRSLTRGLLSPKDGQALRDSGLQSENIVQNVCGIIGNSLDELRGASPEAQTLVAHWLFIDPAFSEAMRGMSHRIKADNAATRERQTAINGKLQQLKHVIDERLGRELQTLSLIGKLPNKHCHLLSLTNLAKTTIQFPDELGSALVQNYSASKVSYTEAESKPASLGLARGHAYVYSAGPVEHAQRTSSMTSAVDALQMTMALSGVLPNNGVGVNTGMGVMQHALGKAEALERNPIVVGFSGNYKNPAHASTHRLEPEDRLLADPRPTIPNFGWIFGPRIVLDPSEKQLRLEQAIATHQVSAEISAPAWWPFLPLETETSWIHNWYDDVKGLDLFQPGTEVSRIKSHVPLPQKRTADIQSLLFDLAKGATKQTFKEVSIDRVTPGKISRCNKKVQAFLIKGTGVWQTTKAYLAGLPHTDIQVLPDMQGVAVQFNLADLPRIPENPKLGIYTRRGSDDYPISLVGGLDGKTCGDEQPDKPLTITSATPIAFCGPTADILVTLKGPFDGNSKENLKSLRAYLGSVKSISVDPISSTSYLLKFPKVDIPPPTDGTVTLTVLTEDGAALSPVRLLTGQCGGAPEKLLLVTAHTAPPQAVNVCTEGVVTVYATGKQFEQIKEAVLKVPYKEGEEAYSAVSLMVSKPDNVVEAKFVFTKKEGRQVLGDSQFVVRDGGTPKASESAKTIAVVCQAEAVKPAQEGKGK